MPEFATRFGVLRPRFLPTLATAAAVVILLNLAMWQLSRHEYKNRNLDAMEAAATMPEAALDGASDVPAMLFRKVTLTGAFEPLLVLEGGRSAVYTGGYGVLQPFRTNDGLRLLIDRGEVRRDGMEDVLARLKSETSARTIRGQLRPLPDGTDKTAVDPAADPVIFPRRGMRGVHGHFPGLTPEVYLRLGEPHPAHQRPKVVRHVDPDLATGYIEVVSDMSSAHYSKQWAAIAVVAVLLWLWASLDRSSARMEDAQ